MHIQIGHQDELHLSSCDSFVELIEQLNDLLGENAYAIEQNGRNIALTSDHPLSEEHTYKIWPKVLGGKGGFGSLLRSFGKQILISKNKEACRDLTGRRMRDVNNEKKLNEWMQKQLEKSVTSSSEAKGKSASSSTEESKDYRNVPPPHKFSDAAYDEQKKQIAEDMNEAVQIAAELIQSERMKKKKKSPTAIGTNDDEADQVESTSKKRRHSEDTLEEGELNNKKGKAQKGTRDAFFLGIDLGDVSSDEEEVPVEDAKKKKKI